MIGSGYRLFQIRIMSHSIRSIVFYLCTNIRLFVILQKTVTLFLNKDRNALIGNPLYWSDDMIELVLVQRGI